VHQPQPHTDGSVYFMCCRVIFRSNQ